MLSRLGGISAAPNSGREFSTGSLAMLAETDRSYFIDGIPVLLTVWRYRLTLSTASACEG
jgi:hypothetical protein